MSTKVTYQNHQPPLVSYNEMELGQLYEVVEPGEFWHGFVVCKDFMNERHRWVYILYAPNGGSLCNTEVGNLIKRRFLPVSAEVVIRRKGA